MLERKGLLDGFTQPVAVFDVAAVVTDPGVENVIQGILS